jgi:hypothetical protein
MPGKCPECHQVIVPSEDVVLAARHKAAATLMGQGTQEMVGAHALFHPECWTRAAPEVWQRVDQKVRAVDVVEEI